MTHRNPTPLWLAVLLTAFALAHAVARENPQEKASENQNVRPPTLDLREPMELAARAIPPRLDPAMDFRPWFMLRGSNNIPTKPEHAMWDEGDMTGRYLESLILTRWMGVSRPEFSEAEWRLQKHLFKTLGADGLVHDPQNGAAVHTFSQGSALYGLLAWFDDTHDPAVRTAIEKLITGEVKAFKQEGDQLIDPSVKIPAGSGSLLAGYEIFPVIRFHELTGYDDAQKLAQGLTRWCMADPILGADGEIKSTDSWGGHIHSWLDTLAGCVRTARNSTWPDRDKVISKCKSVYDWVRRNNTTDFGWIATFPTHGSSETCAISSAMRLALELSACGYTEYLDDVERFVRNQVVEAQFRDIKCYNHGTNHATQLLVGCFDSQSSPNGHLGTRGGEDVGTVEGCCLNGGMRAIALGWDAIEKVDEHGLTVQLALSRNGPGGEVIGYQPFDGRVDVIPRAPGAVRVRVPSWVDREQLSVVLNEQRASWKFDKNFVLLDYVPAGQRVSVRYPLRDLEQDITATNKFHVRWKGDVVVGIDPAGKSEPTYQNRLGPSPACSQEKVPDTYDLQDAARLAAGSMLARIDLERKGQPFFRIYPFSNPPRAEHEKWDDGDMTGRYVEALILARHMTGLPIDARENLLRSYLASLFDPKDGLCYTQEAEWTPRRACMFSQSSAMLGLLAWYRETGSPQVRQLLDKQADGLMRIGTARSNYVYFPKYEFDGKAWIDDPKGKDAPPWYAGRIILPLVEFWQISRRDDVKEFIEKLVRYCTDVSTFIKSDGAVECGEGWWGHLHGTCDMAAGIAEYGRLAKRPELVAWAKRVYEWIGRTQTTRYGYIADVACGNICESCGIASRMRLALALQRAGALDPFDEIDRQLRNQLLENQFRDVTFMAKPQPEKPRTQRTVYDGIDRMIRGTFQCWGTANDLIGHDDIEGCGAGGGVQGLALAWDSQTEWRPLAKGRELQINLLFNRRIRGEVQPPFTNSAPLAGELWSYLPQEGKVEFIAHQKIDRVAFRLPGGADANAVQLRRLSNEGKESRKSASVKDSYAIVENVSVGEKVELQFPLKEYETTERAGGKEFHVRWKGNAVLAIEPRGSTCPLYHHREATLKLSAGLSAPRYP